MTMNESYLEAIDWLSQHPRNAIIIRVKSENELKKYKKYFSDEIACNLFADENTFDRIEWKIDPSI